MVGFLVIVAWVLSFNFTLILFSPSCSAIRATGSTQKERSLLAALSLGSGKIGQTQTVGM